MDEVEFRNKMMADPSRTVAVQKLLDENAQLLKVIVENMSVKGKGADCIQYQQTLHKNLVKLSYLAQPSLDVHNSIPPPPGVSPVSSAPKGGGGVSSVMPSTGGEGSKTTPGNSNIGPPVPLDSSPKVGFSKGYGRGHPWPPGDPYGTMPPGIQISSMGGVGVGHMDPRGYPMGLSHDQQQQLCMHQEQMIHAEQARRLQQQQAAGGGGGGGGRPMYGVPTPQQPQGAGMMGHALPRPPPQVGMPPGYSLPAHPGKSTGNRSNKLL